MPHTTTHEALLIGCLNRYNSDTATNLCNETHCQPAVDASVQAQLNLRRTPVAPSTSVHDIGLAFGGSGKCLGLRGQTLGFGVCGIRV